MRVAFALHAQPSFAYIHAQTNTQCEEILKSADAFCAFDSAAVAAASRDYAKSGEVTVAFWVKPINEKALYFNGMHIPAVSLLSSTSPPTANFQWYLPTSAPLGGEVRLRSSCGRNKNLGGQNMMPQQLFDRSVDPYGWTFVAVTIGKRGQDTFARTVIQSLEFNKNLGSYKWCPYNPEALFEAIEVNYPILISPIMMVAKELPMVQLQQLFYKNFNEIKLRVGPINQNSERVKTSIPIEKVDYVPQSVLMATPIIFQTRVEPTSTCPFQYSTKWLQGQLDQVCLSMQAVFLVSVIHGLKRCFCA
jgi:hypothetical protein